MLSTLGVHPKINAIFNTIMMVLAIGAGGQLGIWLFDRSPPLKVHGYTLTHLSVRPPGEAFEYVSHFTRFRTTWTSVERWIEDGDKRIWVLPTLPYSMSTRRLNEPQDVPVEIYLTDTGKKDGKPFDVADGVAHSCFRSTWRSINNLIHKVWPIRGPVTCMSFIVNRDPVRLGRGLL